jgi:hypothetical protein
MHPVSSISEQVYCLAKNDVIILFLVNKTESQEAVAKLWSNI